MKENKLVLLIVLVIVVLGFNVFFLFDDMKEDTSETAIQAISEDLTSLKGDIALLDFDCVTGNLTCPEAELDCPDLPPVDCGCEDWDAARQQINVIANQCSSIDDIEDDIRRMRNDIEDICDEVDADC